MEKENYKLAVIWNLSSLPQFYNKTEWDDQLSQHATARVNTLLADDSDYDVKKCLYKAPLGLISR